MFIIQIPTVMDHLAIGKLCTIFNTGLVLCYELTSAHDIAIEGGLVLAGKLLPGCTFVQRDTGS